jgi:outer membrane protein
MIPRLLLIASFAFAFFLSPVQPSAQTDAQPKTDDLVSIYKQAIDKDPQFRGAGYDRAALHESLKQAYARLYPEIHGEALYSRISQDIVSSSNPVYTSGRSDYDSQTYTGKLTQSLFQYSLYMEVSQARFLKKRADADFDFAKQDLVLRVAHAYLSALASRENVAFAQAELADVKMMYERAQARYKSGMAPVTDFHDATARLASVNAQLIKAEADYRDALQAIQEISGRPAGELRVLKEELPIILPNPDNPEYWVKMALENNLKIKSTQYDSDIAQKEITKQFSGHYPKIDLVGRYYRQDTGGSLFGGGSVVDTMDVTVQANVPLFEGGLINSKVREAREKSKKSSENLEKQRRAIVRETNASYDGIRSSMSRAEALRKSIESQSVLLEAKEKGYRSGLYTSLTVLDAARDLYMYRRDYAQSRYEYVINTLRLKQAVGTLSETEIVTINGWLQ